MVRICTVFAGGIAKKWKPVPSITTSTPEQSASRARSARKSAKGKGEYVEV